MFIGFYFVFVYIYIYIFFFFPFIGLLTSTFVFSWLFTPKFINFLYICVSIATMLISVYPDVITCNDVPRFLKKIYNGVVLFLSFVVLVAS